MLREKEKEEINKMIKSMFHKLDSKEIDYIVNLSNYYEEYKNKYKIMKENANILAHRNDNAIDFINRYLKLDLDNFDTEGLLTKLKEILERSDKE